MRFHSLRGTIFIKSITTEKMCSHNVDLKQMRAKVIPNLEKARLSGAFNLSQVHERWGEANLANHRLRQHLNFGIRMKRNF
jgi:hypothetical protein